MFGSPMQTWRTRMPSAMLLRSAWAETSLSAPRDEGSIIDWARQEGIERTGPIALEHFLAYSSWFLERFVGDLDPHDVTRIEQRPEGFSVVTESGEESIATRVVIAVGVTPFSHMPSGLRHLEGHERVRLSTDVGQADALEGQVVVVVGGGQAALESASLAIEAGARVEMLVRSRIHWFADREPDRPRGAVRDRLYRLAYPVAGYGPPPVNRLVMYPDLFARFPAPLRSRLTDRLLRPGGSIWLKELVESKAAISEGVTITGATAYNDRLELGLDDGTTRVADQIIVATGYRCDLQRLAFLDPPLISAIEVDHGWPVLDRYFRSRLGDLFFVGYPAQDRFGPIARFVLGARFTALRVHQCLASN